MDCCRTGAHGDVLVARVGWLGGKEPGVAAPEGRRNDTSVAMSQRQDNQRPGAPRFGEQAGRRSGEQTPHELVCTDRRRPGDARLGIGAAGSIGGGVEEEVGHRLACVRPESARRRVVG